MDEFINIAVEGCCHGELDAIYSAIREAQNGHGVKVDLLLICGDFQSIRSFDDFDSVAVPNKYKQLNSFQDYYTGKKLAPVPTVFVGGNHEASNVLQSLYYGGFVAPNIYFLGKAKFVLYLRIYDQAACLMQVLAVLLTLAGFALLDCQVFSTTSIIAWEDMRSRHIPKSQSAVFTICVRWKYIVWPIYLSLLAPLMYFCRTIGLLMSGIMGTVPCC